VTRRDASDIAQLAPSLCPSNSPGLIKRWCDRRSLALWINPIFAGDEERVTSKLRDSRSDTVANAFIGIIE